VALATLGYILMQRGKYVEAEQTLNEAMDIERNVFGQDNVRIAAIEHDLGLLYERTGDLPRARKMIDDALRMTVAHQGPDFYIRGNYLDTLAELKLRGGDVQGSEADARQALALYQRVLPARHLYVASTKQLLAEILLRKGAVAEAEASARAAVDIDSSMAGAANFRTARANGTLGWILIQEGKVAEGEPLLIGAHATLLHTLGAKHPETQVVTARLVQYFHEHHRDADANRVLTASTTH
jgi:tetratricopeptide (TPR) repeat protein